MIKKFSVIIVITFSILVVAGLIIISSAKRSNEVTQNSSSDITLSQKNEVHFLENGCPTSIHQDWVVGESIGCEVSPDKKFVGKFVFNSFYEPEKYYELFIMEAKGSREWKVFSGDFRTLGWEWTKNNKIKIFYNCGTGCRASKVIGLNENLSIANYKDGRMNEENGWMVELIKSF